jgi:hypothetical protein
MLQLSYRKEGLPDSVLFNNEPLTRKVPGIRSKTYTRKRKWLTLLFTKTSAKDQTFIF